MRAQVSAVFLFVVNLVGIGIGPTLVALLTDRGGPGRLSRRARSRR